MLAREPQNVRNESLALGERAGPVFLAHFGAPSETHFQETPAVLDGSLLGLLLQLASAAGKSVQQCLQQGFNSKPAAAGRIAVKPGPHSYCSE